MVDTILCTICGSDWSQDDFNPTCAECGGGANSRSCPACRGICGAIWQRAVMDSQDRQVAHWIGECMLDQSDIAARAHINSDISADWWLDSSAPPDFFWACLVSSPKSGAVIVDLDGVEHPFGGYEAAVEWLRQDEYDLASRLRHDSGDFEILPPPPMVTQALFVSGKMRDRV